MRALLLTLTLVGPAAAPAVDRSAPPPVGPVPRWEVPVPVHSALPNGVDVAVVERRGVPLVDAVLVIPAGAVADPPQTPGLADWTAASLLDGAGGKDALALADAIERLGARIETSVDWGSAYVHLHVPSARLEPALALLADVALRPAFPAAEWERLRERRRTDFLQARDDPQRLARMAAARAVYGPEHRLGLPVEGTAAALARVGAGDLRAFHAARYRPEGAALVVVGDVQGATLGPLLERAFGGWTAQGPAPREPAVPAAPKTPRREILLVDVPGATQSVLVATAATPASLRPLEPADSAMNTLLGGSFTSRLNTNLREEHGYSYGAWSSLDLHQHGGTLAAGSAVAADVTGPALREILRELERIRTPGGADEVRRARDYLALSFPTSFETGADVASFWAWAAGMRLPEERVRSFVAGVQGVEPQALAAAARRDVDPERLKLVVVGDRSAIETQLRGLGLGPVRPVSVEEILGTPQ